MFQQLPRFSLIGHDEKNHPFLCSFDINIHADTDMIWIARVFVPSQFRGKGYGRKMMKAFCDWCDEAGRTAILDINPYPGADMDYDDLVAWYFRCGFIMQKDGSMIRKPKN